MDDVQILFKNGEDIMDMGTWISDADKAPGGFPIPKILDDLRACIDEILNDGEMEDFKMDNNNFQIYIKTQDGFSVVFGYKRDGIER